MSNSVDHTRLPGGCGSQGHTHPGSEVDPGFDEEARKTKLAELTENRDALESEVKTRKEASEAAKNEDAVDEQAQTGDESEDERPA